MILWVHVFWKASWSIDLNWNLVRRVKPQYLLKAVVRIRSKEAGPPHSPPPPDTWTSCYHVLCSRLDECILETTVHYLRNLSIIIYTYITISLVCSVAFSPISSHCSQTFRKHFNVIWLNAVWVCVCVWWDDLVLNLNPSMYGTHLLPCPSKLLKLLFIWPLHLIDIGLVLKLIALVYFFLLCSPVCFI